MSDYAIVHEGHAITPNQTRVKASEVDAHNAAIKQAELARWTIQPSLFWGYYSAPVNGVRTITLWTGDVIGYSSEYHVYRHNFGGRFISMSVRGTNGAMYHGRASYDYGTCINLHKCKKA